MVAASHLASESVDVLAAGRNSVSERHPEGLLSERRVRVGAASLLVSKSVDVLAAGRNSVRGLVALQGG